MPRRKSRTLTELELLIMQALWAEGEDTTVEAVGEVLEREGRPLAPSSIRKMLSILLDKGYVSRKPAEGRGFVYRPRVSEPQAHQGILADIIERAFDGSASRLVASMVDSRMISKKELTQVERLIERQKKGGKR